MVKSFPLLCFLKNGTVTSFSLLGLFIKWNIYIVLVTNLKLKRSHHSRYWILKKVIWFLKIQIPFKILGIAM
jgi:hypothetical protein